MTESQQLHQDLQFVRAAVTRRDRDGRGPIGINYVWAAYVIIGYALLDYRPEFAGWFFMIGGIAGGIASWIIGKRFSQKTGESDRDMARRAMLHFGGGILLAFVGTFALAMIIPDLRGPRGSQVLVVMIGLIYFLAGVHFERYYIWLGPIVVAGGIVVGFLHRAPWTVLGAAIALGLVLPTLFPRRPSDASGPSTLSSNSVAA